MTAGSLRFVLLIVTAAIAALVLSGCAARTQMVSRLDVSGLTVVTLDEPIVLARPVRQLAAAALDYAYLGPVEINRMGNRDYFLWVGLASTIDRKLVGVPPEDVQVLAVLLDGRPMLLPLVHWVANLDRSPYETTAPLHATFAAHASLDQIRRISSAQSVEVHLVSASGVAWRYQKWQGDWSSWSLLAATE
jgi:hypothetical protein